MQFSDGSTWGDRDYAAEVHQLRRATRDKFQSLQKLYSESGEKALTTEDREGTEEDRCFFRLPGDLGGEPLLLAAGRWNDPVHSQILDQLPIVVPGMQAVLDRDSQSRGRAFRPG